MDMIIERTTRRVITLVDDELILEGRKRGYDPKTLWYCVERDGYFGFQNPETGEYLGHDGEGGIRTMDHLLEWEFFTPRRHPAGGYQLLSPSETQPSALRVVCVNGTRLIRRHHGTTLWDFLRVDAL
ncbi:hypothetical protein CTA2_3800 [Colletotrichum tanaceti]|uniref:Uncharacterized protein n=1 Tax=Colletotrichum tanaceti TaxID=1306861 RepID=A0A4U6X0H4_9PEZI|nr:hypothetical protein CTA2_3800 [Colletotrichum tanaceti]TKW48840.1 hypothetical protein CTA1_1379 [Colletotrichum tanaceti]